MHHSHKPPSEASLNQRSKIRLKHGLSAHAYLTCFIGTLLIGIHRKLILCDIGTPQHLPTMAWLALTVMQLLIEYL